MTDDKKDENIEKVKNEEKEKNSQEIEEKLLESIKNKENVTKEKLELAEKIGFQVDKGKIIQTDEFGCVKSEGKSQIEESLSKEELLKINARTEKWHDMLNNYKLYKEKKKDKLKERTRKGIPDSVRSCVWQKFGKVNELIQQSDKDLFEKLEKEKLDEDTELTIIKDLDRTFPSNKFFKDKYGEGQRKLFKVLSYYSKYNKNIGYVQGMAYLVALFLIYMDEQSSFFLLHSLIKNYGLEGIYLPGFPDLKKKFYVFLNLQKKLVPKVYEILKRDGIMPSLYASEWFICLFSKDLKPNILVRIIDTFLLEGFKVIYRFSLALLKMKEKEFVESKPGIINIMNIVKSLLVDIDVDKLFKVAFSFHLSKSHIKKYEQEYEENKNNQNNEFIKQL